MKVNAPIYAELKRLKAAHEDISFDALLLHLVVEHDVAQDAREVKGRANAGKQLPECLVFRRGWPTDGDAFLKEAIEVEAEITKLHKLTINGYKPNLKRGRPKGAKNLKPRKPNQKKLPFVEVKADGIA